MELLDKLANRLRRLNKNQFNELAEQVIEESAEEIADKNRDQLFGGENFDGSEIRPAYTQLTRAIKARKNQPADRVTLRDTGAFHKAIKLKKTGTGSFTLDSSDPKKAKLVVKYGDKIFGLTEQSINEVREEILRPAFLAKLNLELSK